MEAKPMQTAARMRADGSLYASRAEAGVRLAALLRDYSERNPVVVGISGTGLRVAREVAKQLGAELDVMVVRSIGVPGQEQIVLGAIAASGAMYVNASLCKSMRVSESMLEHEIELRHAEAMASERRCRGGLPAVNASGRLVILVDDNLPTGTTLRAAVRSLRSQGAAKIVIAVPVASLDAAMSLESEVDDFVCPHRVDAFAAAAPHYALTETMIDKDVELSLRRARRPGL